MQRFREETTFKRGEKAGRIRWRDSISTYFTCNPNYTLRLENSSSRLRRRPDPQGKKETGKSFPERRKYPYTYFSLLRRWFWLRDKGRFSGTKIGNRPPRPLFPGLNGGREVARHFLSEGYFETLRNPRFLELHRFLKPAYQTLGSRGFIEPSDLQTIRICFFF